VKRKRASGTQDQIRVKREEKKGNRASVLSGEGKKRRGIADTPFETQKRKRRTIGNIQSFFHQREKTASVSRYNFEEYPVVQENEIVAVIFHQNAIC